MSCRVLKESALIKGLLREAKEERVTAINTGGHETVNKDGGTRGGDG